MTKMWEGKGQLIQTIVIFIFSIGGLIELKFCQVSRNSFSNRCWEFQLSVLKNKKVLFLKNYFFGRCRCQNRKALFTGSILLKGFGWYSNNSIKLSKVYLDPILSKFYNLPYQWFFNRLWHTNICVKHRPSDTVYRLWRVYVGK